MARAVEQTSIDRPMVYQAPAVRLIGAVSEFTFGSTGPANDGGVTTKKSDRRIKREIRSIGDALAKLSSL